MWPPLRAAFHPCYERRCLDPTRSAEISSKIFVRRAVRRGITGWGLIPATEVSPARTRADTTPQQGYFPLDQATVDGADAPMHITGWS
ncbi:hypothetical protein [Micromonospora globispora]|uniref:hypothetical protein n=1 Tax=Micromonospora globispora TaxID=1450148 RepID=UPI001A9C7F36|nr:hypothetical protein [Micromonospora globispora]